MTRKLNDFESALLEPLRSKSYYIVRNQFCLTLQHFYLAKPILDELFNGSSFFYFLKDSFSFVQQRPGIDLKLGLMLNEENSNFNCSQN